MNTQQLMDSLQARDINLTVAGGNLKVSAPAGLLTADLQAELRQHKSALVAMLTQQPLPLQSQPPTLPVTITWPAAASVAVLSKRWHRRADGSIEATYHTADELRACLEVTEALREFEQENRSKER